MSRQGLDQPDSFSSYDGALFAVEEGIRDSNSMTLFAYWVTGRMFPDVDPNKQSVFIGANWLDAAIIVEQFRGVDSFLESVTPDDVVKFITTGARLTVQPKNDFIPVECLGFDSVKKNATTHQGSKVFAYFLWSQLADSAKPSLFVASRHGDYVVQATTTVSKQELLNSPHPAVTEAIPNYPVTSLTAKQLAQCIAIGQSVAK